MFVLNGDARDMHGKKLHCMFASGVTDGKQLKMEDADTKTASFKHFMQELLWCDSVLFHGGDTPTLLTILNKFPQEKLKSILCTKTVVAQSAGISALTYASANFDRWKIVEGLGVVPIVSIVHYVDWKHAAIKQLQELYPTYPIVLIKDEDCIRWM